jgi:hypothetical protein
MTATANGEKRIPLVLVQETEDSVWVAKGSKYRVLCQETLGKYVGVENYTRAELVLSQTPSKDAYKVWVDYRLGFSRVSIRVGHRIEQQHVYSYFFDEVRLFCSDTGKKSCWASLELVCEPEAA